MISMKFLGINLTKGIQNLYTEKHKNVAKILTDINRETHR